MGITFLSRKCTRILVSYCQQSIKVLAIAGFKNKNKAMRKERENFVKVFLKQFQEFLNTVFSPFNPQLKIKKNK